MKLHFEIAGQRCRCDLAEQISIAIPLSFGAQQPNLFDAPRAKASHLEVPGFVGSTRLGGSCNVERVELIPHCNGTHTESVGHIVHDEISVPPLAAMMVTALVSIRPRPANELADRYPGSCPQDLVIGVDDLQAAWESQAPWWSRETPSALVVRTLPNDATKLTAAYNNEPLPAYFSQEAIAWMNASGVQHLLVDTPSIDRVLDEGRLANHHAFWNVEPGCRRLGKGWAAKTITEFIYVPDDLPDGPYLLNLQMPDWQLEALPSRPLLCPLHVED